METKKINRRLITYSSDCPKFNIALDEALFESSIKTRTPIIRFWENKKPCIYLGIGKVVRRENPSQVINDFSNTLSTTLNDLRNIANIPTQILNSFTALVNGYDDVLVSRRICSE